MPRSRVGSAVSARSTGGVDGGRGGGVAGRGGGAGTTGLIDGIAPTFIPTSVEGASRSCGGGGGPTVTMPGGTGIGGGAIPVIVVIGRGRSGIVFAGLTSGEGPGTGTSGRTNSLVGTSGTSRPSAGTSIGGAWRGIGPVPTCSATMPDISLS